jgi:hypothetical protein
VAVSWVLYYIHLHEAMQREREERAPTLTLHSGSQDGRHNIRQEALAAAARLPRHGSRLCYTCTFVYTRCNCTWEEVYWSPSFSYWTLQWPRDGRMSTAHLTMVSSVIINWLYCHDWLNLQLRETWVARCLKSLKTQWLIAPTIAQTSAQSRCETKFDQQVVYSAFWWPCGRRFTFIRRRPWAMQQVHLQCFDPTVWLKLPRAEYRLRGILWLCCAVAFKERDVSNAQLLPTIVKDAIICCTQWLITALSFVRA